MTEWERLIGSILVALVKAAGTNELTLMPEDLAKEPHEVAYIYNNGDGSLTIKVKDVRTLDT